MSLSFVIAFRESGDGHRTVVWEFIRARLKKSFPDAEIVVGTDDGEDPFHKTLALNRAVKESSGDVLGIWDSDTWCPPDQVNMAASAIEANPLKWWKPWTRKLKLAEQTTARLLEHPEWDGTVDPHWRMENRNFFWCAPPVMMSREAFDEAGQMDERIRGWGGDDEALGFALKGLFGGPETLQGDALHLWHPRIGRSGRDFWPGQEGYPNTPIVSAYQRASRKTEDMRRLLAER